MKLESIQMRDLSDDLGRQLTASIGGRPSGAIAHDTTHFDQLTGDRTTDRGADESF
jgi:hypothetical protein